MDPPRPHEGDRRRKRRELDARRSKCRIRLGGHLEQWCRLKEQLGFALHSQLAKFLLDRSAKTPPTPQKIPPQKPLWAAHGSPCCSPLHLHDLISLTPHPCFPTAQMDTETTAPDQERADAERCIPASEEKVEPQAVPREEEEEEEDFAEEDDLAYTDDLRDENYLPSQDSDAEPQRRQSQPHTRKKPVKEEQTPNEQNPMDSSSAQEKGGGVSCQQPTRPCDEDVAQIGPKRIRKAAKREILLCDFEGCGKIFSNRQYLNHHKKYQHVHQKTFTCSEPSCGKSFNFKKHLKEHEKLHSGEQCPQTGLHLRVLRPLLPHQQQPDHPPAHPHGRETPPVSAAPPERGRGAPSYPHTPTPLCPPPRCEICGFTCRQKASLNWHMKKHDADAFYQFSCDLCGKKFEKKDNVTAHKSKSHPEAPPQAAPSPPPSAGTPQIELREGDAPSGAEKGDGHPPPAH
ncbi:UNVERIFIED_CONTAM: hypothetical protein H355_002501 [Colinus virginianus]|nr:hypothetical protein H355_002501 [Colinus virginianus]